MENSFGRILRDGVLAGLVAGAAAALVALLVVKPRIRAALRIEQERAHAGGGHAHSHEEMFGRLTQVIGGMVAAVVVAVALGALFAVVFARLRHLLPARTEFGRTVQLAVVGFFAWSLLPALKYPANPPGVGGTDTVTYRTVTYFSVILAGVVIVALAYLLRGYCLRHGWSSPATVTVTALAVTLLSVLVLWAWPDNPDPIPADVPAGLLWRFRLSSLAELATLWGVLGLVFGLLSERRVAATNGAQPVTAAS
ncbi:CbtA family protein [Actinopolyspora mortivallis]|uniref:CbtA family protein n=1 Tax=Actinopolyspora mortivallis TaxID=33906 RepID=UPI00035C7884|nr:CbtA family protein [Actinopolyspora mortivallis]